MAPIELQSASTMKEKQFWTLIEKLDWSHEGDDAAVIAPVVAALAKMKTGEIEDFETILSEKLFALDTEVHAREIGEYAYSGPDSGFSVDWFLYERCCAIANGKRFFDLVISDPTKMPKDMEFEALLTVAAEAYKKKTGDDFAFSAPLSYETFSNEAGWPQPD